MNLTGTLPPHGTILEDHRDRAGLSKSDVARHMSSSRAQYDRIIHAPRPTVTALTRAAQAVGVTNTAPLLRSAGYDPGLVARRHRATNLGSDSR